VKFFLFLNICIYVINICLHEGGLDWIPISLLWSMEYFEWMVALMMTGILRNCLQLQMGHLTPNLSKISFNFEVAICPSDMWQTFATNMPMVYGLVIKHL
jgi:hypothetical protein